MSKFKIGDRVRVMRNTDSEFDGVEIGDIGVVINIYKQGKFPIGLRIGEHNEYCFKEEELELVTDDGFKLETNNNTYPLGIMPKEIWLKKRKQDILDGIERFAESEIVIPIEWVKELKELEENGV